jgi:uncharacterized heparinase superfamily protein
MRREVVDTFVPPFRPATSMTAPTEFRFLNESRICAEPEDWSMPGASKLWVYNLHYFDDLNAVNAVERTVWHEDLIARWTSEIAACEGVGWEPYPTSLRIVNWIKWTLRGGALSSTAIDSLAVQARALRQRLEYHILGNHLFANAKALVYSGLFFSWEEARDWRNKGLEILNQELKEQVLDDGGHFELSVMYHSTFLNDLLDIINVFRAYGHDAPQEWLETAARMTNWLDVMSHPDGEIAFFNDAAFGIAPTIEDISGYAERLSIEIPTSGADDKTVLSSSGYARFSFGRLCLICDCAEIGPRYQPGHAHADSLSFELSILNKRVFVNSGTSTYEIGREREWQRGTAAHNTVVVGGANSSEVWAGFRVARRAHVALQDPGAADPRSISGYHDGYCRKPWNSTHFRRWTVGEHEIVIEDVVSGKELDCDAYFYLHPDVRIIDCTADNVLMKMNVGIEISMHFAGSARVDIKDSNWHPHFGGSEKNSVVVANFVSPTLRTHIRWTTP